jgi:hypothetical protein
MSPPRFALILTLPALAAWAVCGRTPSAGADGPAAGPPPGVSLIGVGTVEGTARDKSGLTELFPVKIDDRPEDVPHDRLGGFGSAVAYTGSGNRYVGVPDRGPGDGAADFRPRLQFFDIVVTPGAEKPVTVTHVGTRLLTRGGERDHFSGLSSRIDGDVRLDPEGARVSASGKTLFVSDEYGPHVYEFDLATGRRVGLLSVPEKFRLARPNADPLKESADNRSGRAPNRGFEGLAISPDGSKLYALLQSPLLQDGGRDGVNTRMVEFDAATGKALRELVYVTDGPKSGLNEIVAVNDRQFLVIERDNLGGEAAKAKRLMLIDISEATDVSAIPALPGNALPAGVKPVSKQVFLDLLSPPFGLAGAEFPAKIEGLAFGPDLPDGRHLLLVTTDNDFKGGEPSRIWAFAVAREALPGFVPQKIAR